MYEHLLVALDGSPAAEQVLVHVQALAQAFRSTVTLLRATVSAEMLVTETAGGEASVIGELAPPAMDPTPIVDADRESATEYLEQVAGRLRAAGMTVKIEEPEGPADHVIVDRAMALGVSLILMTTHGRGGLGRMVFGSVADSVLRHAPCPVLLVRVKDEGPA